MSKTYKKEAPETDSGLPKQTFQFIYQNKKVLVEATSHDEAEAILKQQEELQ